MMRFEPDLVEVLADELLPALGCAAFLLSLPVQPTMSNAAHASSAKLRRCIRE
jgi:hypothetical protein